MTVRSPRFWAAIAVACLMSSAACCGAELRDSKAKTPTPSAGPAANNTLSAAEKQAGWKLLFDGKTLDGWTIPGSKEGWVVADGTIKCTAKGGDYLHTNEQFADFALSIDFKYPKDANSGVFFRWTKLDDPVNTGIEMQILDTYGWDKPSKTSCGAIYEIKEPSKKAEKPAGEWNNAVIFCNGSRIRVRLNGVQIINMDLNRWTKPHKNPDGTENKFPIAYKTMTAKGYIGLQDHGSPLWFRNIKIRPLDKPNP